MGNIILQRRADNDYWAIPGGNMEVGEKVQNTLYREALEETGLTCRVERIIVGIYSDPDYVIEYSDGEVRQELSIYFSGFVLGGTLQCSAVSCDIS
jgi:8-oxo-dGTP pyrophosphatase MutT (NUDIX family)